MYAAFGCQNQLGYNTEKKVDEERFDDNTDMYWEVAHFQHYFSLTEFQSITFGIQPAHLLPYQSS